MKKSIEILNMSSVDLANLILEQANENPFLEIEEESIEFEKTHYIYEELHDNISNVLTLSEHLRSQFRSIFSPDERKIFIAEYITNCLDDNGYIIDSSEEIAAVLKISQQEVHEIIQKLRTLDPIGCYSRDFKECLKVQAQEIYLGDPNLLRLIDNIELLAKRDFNKLAKVLKLSQEYVMALSKKILNLNPKPGRDFCSQITQIRKPDMLLIQLEKGEFVVTLNKESLPLFNVKFMYFKQIYENCKNDNERKFCNEAFSGANWLCKTITQRNASMLKIANFIASKQYEFFQYGIDYLKPMTLSQISKEVELHESTISRLGDKTILTPFGILALKYFLSNSINSEFSEDCISAKALKNKIKDMILAEKEGRDILTDQDIALKLKEIGINISRRTVAKYRESMMIEPSHVRKRSVA